MNTAIWELILIILLGLVVGSFINVVVYRLNQRLSIGGRSFCPHCRRILAPKDLVPVFSFIMLAGRCRYCQKRISWQYPIVEAVTAILFAVFSWQYLTTDLGLLNLALWRDLVVISFLTIIFIYDLKYYLILDSVSIPAIFIVLIFNFLIGENLDGMFWGVVIAGGFFLLQYIISDGKWIGGGDIRLGILMGIILGWQLTIVSLFVAYFLGAIVGVVLLFKKKNAKWSHQVPFGTFLSLATLIAMLFGQQILNWYLQLI